MSNNVEYVGKDLEAMDFALNYHRWILSLIKPFLGEHLVEVGAGTGSFSELLLETAPKSLTLVEPSEMFEVLEQQDFTAIAPSTKIRSLKNIFANICDELTDTQIPDTIIYINVLEHIEEDGSELELVNKCLSKNGKVVIFVPALPVLYSEFDKSIGHFRRYTKRDLTAKCENANFRIVMSRYFDLPGIFPWLIKYRALKSLSMESGAVQLYDKAIVPVTSRFEKLITPPIGKNLLFVCEKL